MAALRHPEKFESLDGGVSYSFPLNQYEWQSSQGLLTPTQQIAGAHYPFDFLGTLAGKKQAAVESIRFLDRNDTQATLETELDNLKSKLFSVGLGKLFTIDSDASTRRWAYARLAAMPQLTLGVLSNYSLPVVLQFARMSSWFGTSQQTPNSGAITSSPVTFTINNPGNERMYSVAMKLHANSAGGFTNPLIENLTAGYSWSSTRDSASNGDELIVDAGAYTVQFNGSDDYAHFTKGSQQVAYMALEPGNNSIRATIGGTPNVTITFTFYGAYN